MLRLDSKNTSYSAALLIGGAQVAYLSASRTGDNVSFSMSIDDIDSYIINAAAFKTDIADFLDTVAEVAPAD